MQHEETNRSQLTLVTTLQGSEGMSITRLALSVIYSFCSGKEALGDG
jgi:hypothetical protein